MLSKKLSRTLNNNDPKLKVDLSELFGRFPKSNSDDLREAIGSAIIDRIVERTESGNFLERSSGAGKYSDEYVNSFEFKVYGKSKGKVNLKASGDMLRSIDILKSEKESLEIGFQDKTNAEKAHGHITGSVGKTRDFFGITDTDLNDIRREFKAEVDDRVLSENRSITEGLQRRQGESLFDFLRRAIGERGIR